MLFKYIVFTLFIVSSLLGKSNFGAIATGSTTGTYIQIGKDLSTVFKEYNSVLEVIPTKGSKSNLDALTGKNEHARAKWAIVQSDTLDYYNFLHFKSTKKDVTGLIKTILPMYSEHIHMFIKKGNEKKISFKKGSTIIVGVPSKTSGSHITANLLENAYGVTFSYRYINYKKAMHYLKTEKIDIYMDVISLPAKKYTNIKGISLLQLPKNNLMNKRYIRATFNKNNYKWLDKDVIGYKVPSVLVTNRVDKKYNQTVGVFIKVILNNYKDLIKNGHPKWKEAYRNKFLKVNNMHPVAYKILHQ